MRLVSLYFNGVFCGWADPRYAMFFRVQGYNIVSLYEWQPL